MSSRLLVKPLDFSERSCVVYSSRASPMPRHVLVLGPLHTDCARKNPWEGSQQVRTRQLLPRELATMSNSTNSCRSTVLQYMSAESFASVASSSFVLLYAVMPVITRRYTKAMVIWVAIAARLTRPKNPFDSTWGSSSQSSWREDLRNGSQALSSEWVVSDIDVETKRKTYNFVRTLKWGPEWNLLWGEILRYDVKGSNEVEKFSQKSWYRLYSGVKVP